MAIINVIEERKEILEALKEITSRNPGTTITHAIIKYDLIKGIPDTLDYKNYPLKLVGKMSGGSLVIRVNNVVAGSICEESQILKEILSEFGFEFEDNDIFTTKVAKDDMILIVYRKGNAKSEPP